ncbi:MAG: selenocysteine-specific translation elongation factor, partial [Gammaproteobacteria bacterium]|nr:selenocysteine-specific translation elongation factor [Gammaproteobacteria bacterium]
VDTDSLKEEKQRGRTIDLGFAYIDAETGQRLGFVDVPGHIRFISNMLAGVSTIDFALLVIAADDGIMPQTVEHMDVLKLLGITRGAIALTKIDRVDSARITEVTDEIEQFIAGSFLDNADILPVSAITGEGVDTVKLALDIAADDTEQKSAKGLFRLAIDRRFTVHGAGIVVTGSVFSGKVEIGDSLTLMPQGIPVRVRGLHTQNQISETATIGDRCAVNLASAKLEIEDIHRGNWLTNNSGEPSDRIDARLTLLESETKALPHWTPVHFHTAANHVTARVAMLEGSRIAPGDSGLVQLVLDDNINICVGDRFVIRDQAALRTIGGGVIIDPFSPKRGRAKTERLNLLKCIDPASPAATLEAMLAQSPSGVDTFKFGTAFNLQAEQLQHISEGLETVVAGAGRIIGSAHFEKALDSLLQHLDTWHAENPGKPGLPVSQVTRLVRLPAELLEQAIAELVAREELQQDGNLVKRPGQGVQLSKKELATFEKILPLIQADPIKPPVLHDLAKSMNLDPKSLEKILNQVVKTGQLIKPVKNRYFVPEAIETLKLCLHEAANDAGQFTVQQYRDAAGTGRNLAIELLEYFDRLGITRRQGDVRQIME